MSDGVKKTPSRTIRSPRRQKTTANLGAAEFPQGGFADRGCPIKRGPHEVQGLHGDGARGGT